MSELIHRQLFEVFIMFYCGMAMMMIVEVRNRCMKIVGERSRLSVAFYFASCLCIAFLFCQFLYRCAYGVLSIHGIVAAAMGILLWKKVIYGIIDTGNVYERKESKRKSPEIRRKRPSNRRRRVPERATRRRAEKEKSQNK